MRNSAEERLCENCGRPFIPNDVSTTDPRNGQPIEKLQLVCDNCELAKEYPDEEDGPDLVEEDEDAY